MERAAVAGMLFGIRASIKKKFKNLMPFQKAPQ
jgi:hypothetical protein